MLGLSRKGNIMEGHWIGNTNDRPPDELLDEFNPDLVIVGIRRARKVVMIDFRALDKGGIPEATMAPEAPNLQMQVFQFIHRNCKPGQCANHGQPFQQALAWGIDTSLDTTFFNKLWKAITELFLRTFPEEHGAAPMMAKLRADMHNAVDDITAQLIRGEGVPTLWPNDQYSPDVHAN